MSKIKYILRIRELERQIETLNEIIKEMKEKEFNGTDLDSLVVAGKINKEVAEEVKRFKEELLRGEYERKS